MSIRKVKVVVEVEPRWFSFLILFEGYFGDDSLVGVFEKGFVGVPMKFVKVREMELVGVDWKTCRVEVGGPTTSGPRSRWLLSVKA